ncbi:MAG: UDP-4-amino-4,6-dideoxy-N-acetyl-beta-L-altrosamine transaminase [Candidatus Tantalella remota]|nr:UDP-4-amino-4,6-dideoxy-N-acetyl-beta-L-altrosamine transaminase [Candidatus Tantalella remota]
MKYIPYGKQYIEEDDIKQVVKVLRSDWITQGKMVGDFEKAIARYCGSKYAVVVSSGTAALHIACLAGGLAQGDEAITTPITFLATPNAVLYTGARPVFADVDPVFSNIDPAGIEKKITSRTKAVLPVHFAGMPCDMPRISSIAKKNSLLIIEDACHALGAEYFWRGKKIMVGSCEHSDMTVFSFHPVKHITTGEGGAITTNNRKIYEKLKALRSHGTYKTEGMTKKKGPWYYEMRDLGFNYRITDFQCALGLSQIKKLKGFLKKRRDIAKVYDRSFGTYEGISIPGKSGDRSGAYHLYILKIDFDSFNLDRKTFFKRMKDLGVACQVHYIPVYLQPYYRELGYSKGLCPNAEKVYKEEVSIPLFPAMKDDEVLRVVESVQKTLNI